MSDSYFQGGAVESSAIIEADQWPAEKCGPNRPIEAKSEIPAAPSPFVPDFFDRFARHILPEPNTGCWLWTGTALPAKGAHRPGHGWFRVKGLFCYAHRAAYEATHGEGSAAGSLVRHRCDMPPCVNPDHLELGTVADNARDMVERRRSAHGERNGTTNLKAAEVAGALAMLAAGATQDEVARKYGLSQSAVSLIKQGRRWTTDFGPQNPEASAAADARRRLIQWGLDKPWPIRHRVYNLAGSLSALIEDPNDENVKQAMQRNADELARYSKHGPVKPASLSPAELAACFGLSAHHPRDLQ